MKTLSISELRESDKSTIWNIAQSCDIMFDTARLLFYRGIDTVEKVRNFLSPGKSRFYDPFLLSGMKEAVERVKIAKENAQNVYPKALVRGNPLIPPPSNDNAR